MERIKILARSKGIPLDDYVAGMVTDFRKRDLHKLKEEFYPSHGEGDDEREAIKRKYDRVQGKMAEMKNSTSEALKEAKEKMRG